MTHDDTSDKERIAISTIADRVRTSKEVLGHPHYMHGYRESVKSKKLPVREGVHYEVLATTLWADYFVPTYVRWLNGADDNFSDPHVSKRNQRESKELAARRAPPEAEKCESLGEI